LWCRFYLLVVITRELNPRPVRTRERSALNKQHLRAVCSPEQHSLASECAACKAAGNRAALLRACKRQRARRRVGWLGWPISGERSSPQQIDSGTFGFFPFNLGSKSCLITSQRCIIPVRCVVSKSGVDVCFDNPHLASKGRPFLSNFSYKSRSHYQPL
jgi:hypothetical protein